MQHRTLRYTIAYLTKEGKERGREWCVLSLHGNGDRTMRAMCEMGDSEVLRDVTPDNEGRDGGPGGAHDSTEWTTSGSTRPRRVTWPIGRLANAAPASRWVASVIKMRVR